MPGFPVAFRRTGVRFLGILFPPRVSAPLTIGLPDLTARTRRGYHVPRFRDSAGLGALFTPRPAVLTRPTRTPRPPLAASSSGQALSPRSTSHLPGLSITRHHQGFTFVRPPGLPLAWSLPRMEQGPFGFFPRLRTPIGRTYRRTPRRGRASSTRPRLRNRHTSASNLRAHSQYATSCRTSGGDIGLQPDGSCGDVSRRDQPPRHRCSPVELSVVGDAASQPPLLPRIPAELPQPVQDCEQSEPAAAGTARLAHRERSREQAGHHHLPAPGGVLPPVRHDPRRKPLRQRGGCLTTHPRTRQCLRRFSGRGHDLTGCHSCPPNRLCIDWWLYPRDGVAGGAAGRSAWRR